jgi:hypothetical protein
VPGERDRANGWRTLGPTGEARAEDRRLGEARALPHARERVLADELDALGEQSGEHARNLFAKRARLASLAWEQAGYHSSGH